MNARHRKNVFDLFDEFHRKRGTTPIQFINYQDERRSFFRGYPCRQFLKRLTKRLQKLLLCFCCFQLLLYYCRNIISRVFTRVLDVFKRQ